MNGMEIRGGVDVWIGESVNWFREFVVVVREKVHGFEV